MPWELAFYLAGIPITAVASYVVVERTMKSQDVIDQFLAGTGALFSGLIWPVLVLGYAVALAGKAVDQRHDHAKRKEQRVPKTVHGQTLEEVVDLYLRELDNPAPDISMRTVYRQWMREFVPEFTAER